MEVLDNLPHDKIVWKEKQQEHTLVCELHEVLLQKIDTELKDLKHKEEMKESDAYREISRPIQDSMINQLISLVPEYAYQCHPQLKQKNISRESKSFFHRMKDAIISYGSSLAIKNANVSSFYSSSFIPTQIIASLSVSQHSSIKASFITWKVYTQETRDSARPSHFWG